MPAKAGIQFKLPSEGRYIFCMAYFAQRMALDAGLHRMTGP
jgi:hypothetical protein